MTSVSWLIIEGFLNAGEELRVGGFKEEYGAIKYALLSAHKKFNHILELYSVSKNGEIKEIPKANPLQVWSSAGLLDLLSKN